MRNIVLTALALSGLWGGPMRAAEVWIGGSRAWGDYTTPGKADQWKFIQANTNGLYINNFAMRPNESDKPTRQERLDGMYNLLAHKKVFYETDLIHSQDDFDQQSINLFKKTGFDYVGVTINYGVNDARAKIITQDGKLPLFYMFGPWNHEGDINKPKNAELRANVLKYDGAAVDDPVVVWRGKTGSKDTKPMVYSTVKWCHANNKKFLFLLAPNDSGPGFLGEAQALVRDLEDHHANPDIWAVAFYGPQSFRDKLEVLPEADAAGKPAKTFSGAAYWLMHHLKDPKKWAALTLPDGLAAGHDGRREVTVELANRSDWLDLVPVLRLTHTAGYRITVTLDGRDVTADLLGDGLIFDAADRLTPGRKRLLHVSIENDAAMASGAEPRIELSPHPSEPDVVNQTLPLTAAAAAQVAAR